VPLVERVFYDPIETAKDLAKELATIAKKIEQIIPRVYRDEKSEKDGYLHKLSQAKAKRASLKLTIRAVLFKI
jgi:hypothetical protein